MSERLDGRCPRCAGGGKVVGVGRDERAWTDFRDVPVHLALSKILGMRAPRICPACGGSGTASPRDHEEEGLGSE